MLTLPEDVVACFWRDGFGSLDRIVPDDEVAELRSVYDRLFSSRSGWERGDFFDTRAVNDEREPLSLPQMYWPSKYEPRLRETSYHRNATHIARSILGPGAELVWEFAILKPPAIGAPTPWHQDEAYFRAGADFDTVVSFWLPLQDVDETNGCMQFVPGSHKSPLLPHQSLNGDPRSHALEARNPDVSAAVAVPLRAGGVVFHHSRCLHGAGPNLSGGPRRAYILEFAVRSGKPKLSRDFPWNTAKRTARDVREDRSLSLPRRLARSLRRSLTQMNFPR